ncbi:MAG: DUF6916 family protein [Thermoanaerobaculia bacterium]
MTVDLRDLTHENTKQYTGDTFHVPFDNGMTIDLVLEEVVVMMEKHLNPRMKRDAFSWRFRGPLDFRLPQNTYNMTHDKLGELRVFIVPIGVVPEGALYEALFN